MGICHGRPYSLDRSGFTGAQIGDHAIGSADWTEAELIELMAIAEGDRADGDAREAFGEFYERHEPWLRAMVRSGKLGRLLDWDEGRKDAVQFTFQKAFLSASRFDLEKLAGADPETAAKRVRAWLGGIANHVITDILRAQVPEVELFEDREETTSPLELLCPPEPTAREKNVAAELAALSEKEQQVIAADMEHKTGMANEHLPPGVAQALADEWGTTTANVRKVRQRAREKLTDRLAHLVE